MARDQNTPDQLKREIAYFAGVAQRTTSPDRIRRARVAIAVRERQLAAALRRIVRPQEEPKP